MITQLEKIDERTKDIALDAMVVWEWAMETLADDKEGPLAKLFERYGYCEMRERLLRSVPYVRVSWHRAADAGYEDSFDWEFVPWFFANCADFETCSYDIDKLPPGYEKPVKTGRHGWALFINSVCQGLTPVMRTSDEADSPAWFIFETEREAQLEVAEDVEEHIQQFKNGEREFGEIDFADTIILPVILREDGWMVTETQEFPPPHEWDSR